MLVALVVVLGPYVLGALAQPESELGSGSAVAPPNVAAMARPPFMVIDVGGQAYDRQLRQLNLGEQSDLMKGMKYGTTTIAGGVGYAFFDESVYPLESDVVRVFETTGDSSFTVQDGKVNNSVGMYDEWFTSENKPVFGPPSRRYAASASIGSYAVVSGGGPELGEISRKDVWACLRLECTRISDMLQGRSSHAMVNYRDELWVLGGFDDEAPDPTSKYLRSAERYSFRNGKHCGGVAGNIDGPMVDNDGLHYTRSACNCNEKCLQHPDCMAWTFDLDITFAISQTERIDCILRKSFGDPKNDCPTCISGNMVATGWSPATQLPHEIAQHTAVVMGGRIVVIGGVIASGNGNSVEAFTGAYIYDHATDNWDFTQAIFNDNGATAVSNRQISDTLFGGAGVAVGAGCTELWYYDPSTKKPYSSSIADGALQPLLELDDNFMGYANQHPLRDAKQAVFNFDGPSADACSYGLPPAAASGGNNDNDDASKIIAIILGVLAAVLLVALVVWKRDTIQKRIAKFRSARGSMAGDQGVYALM